MNQTIRNLRTARDREIETVKKKDKLMSFSDLMAD